MADLTECIYSVIFFCILFILILHGQTCDETRESVLLVTGIVGVDPGMIVVIKSLYP